MMRSATAEEFAMLERAKADLPAAQTLTCNHVWNGGRCYHCNILRSDPPSSLFSLTDVERGMLGCMIESYGPAEVLAQFVSIASEKASRVRLHFPDQAKAWDETATRLAAIVPGICERLG